MIAETISVIVPVYNAEKYLDRCVESIVAQTYKNLEIILVDDGSTDNSPAICDAWAKKDSRIRVIYKKNGGVSSARNAGLDACTGDYIGFADADDWMEPDMYEVLIGNAKRYSADKSSCGYIYYGQQAVCAPAETCRVLQSSDEIRLRIVSGEHNAVWCAIYSRSVVGDIRFDESLKVAEDWLFNYQVCLKMSSEVIVNTPLYHYEDNIESAMHGINEKKISDRISVLEYIWNSEYSREKHLPQLAGEYVPAFFYGVDECIRENVYKEKWYKKKVKKELNGKLMFILRSDMSRIVKIKVVMYVFAHPLYVRYIKKKHA